MQKNPSAKDLQKALGPRFRGAMPAAWDPGGAADTPINRRSAPLLTYPSLVCGAFALLHFRSTAWGLFLRQAFSEDLLVRFV
jgi:hypothetical protein